MTAAVLTPLVALLVGIAVPMIRCPQFRPKVNLQALANSPLCPLVVLGVPALASLVAVLWSL